MTKQYSDDYIINYNNDDFTINLRSSLMILIFMVLLICVDLKSIKSLSLRNFQGTTEFIWYFSSTVNKERLVIF